MTPGARLQTAIDLLDGVLSAETRPADRIVDEGLRARRYAGSKDRAAISDIVYGVLRRKSQIDWWLNWVRGDAATPRNRALIYHQFQAKLDYGDMAALCDGSAYAPDALSRRETRVAIELAGSAIDKRCQPLNVRMNIPAWLWPEWVESLGSSAQDEALALGSSGPVDLRINTLKSDRESVAKELAAAEIASTPTAMSPVGLRLTGRKPLKGLKAFREGRLEVQDEGSQLAAILCDARPGMKVVDFCAGVGGKTLQLAADLQNKGRIVACDIDKRRLDEAAVRLKRAGAFCVERRLLGSENDSWVKNRAARHGGGFDRVLVDAPCTGSGAWRRRPEERWRLTPEKFEELQELQDRMLDSAARLVNRGGRLIYVTCSVLRLENTAIVERFLNQRQDFHPVPVEPIWQNRIGGACPADGPYLQLTPGRDGTDGFFVAILERRL